MTLPKLIGGCTVECFNVNDVIMVNVPSKKFTKRPNCKKGEGNFYGFVFFLVIHEVRYYF